MTLLAALSRAKTEEDVKDAYIKELGLKGVFKGLVDIQTEEVWFEAKEAATAPILDNVAKVLHESGYAAGRYIDRPGRC